MAIRKKWLLYFGLHLSFGGQYILGHSHLLYQLFEANMAENAATSTEQLNLKVKSQVLHTL